MNIATAIAVYIVVITLVGFLIMGIDKRKAIKDKWRIPEKTLFIVAAIGGSLGCIAGMLTFHHKTKKWYFMLGMPLILIIQLLLAYIIGSL